MELNHDSVLSRLKFGWEEAFRFRSTGTPWEVNYVPKFFSDSPSLVPTKTQFLEYMAIEFLTDCLFLDVLGFFGRDVPKKPINFASNRIPLLTRLLDVTTEEVVLRLIAFIMYWVATVFLLQIMYDRARLVVNAFDYGRMERWPPLFNS